MQQQRSSWHKVMLFCGLALLLAGLEVAAKPANRASIPAPRNKNWWLARHEQINHAAGREQMRLVFLDDSITAGWDLGGAEVWQKYYSSRRAMTMAITIS